MPTATKKKSPKKSATKKTTAKKASAKKEKTGGNSDLASRIASAIIAGDFDGDLSALDDALTTRSNAQQKEAAKEEKTTTKKTTEKKVSAAPKRASKSMTPVEGKVYGIASAFKKLAGAKVEFQRFHGDSTEKVVVKMKTDKPGNPKGKRVVIPLTALEEDKKAKKNSKK